MYTLCTRKPVCVQKTNKIVLIMKNNYDEMEQFAITNPKATVKEIAEKYNVSIDVAFTVICEASKKL